VEDSADYTGEASGTVDPANNRINLVLGVKAPVGATYKVYAEVFGAKQGEESTQVPISWIGGVVEVSLAGGNPVMNLELNVNWITLAGATEPFVLKSVRLQDLTTSIPLSCYCEMPVKMASSVVPLLLTSIRPSEITEEMRHGKRPAEFGNATDLATQFVLLHGYCSATNPWQEVAADFTNAHYFVNPKASISHDQFAKLVHTFAQGRGATAYSILGHSQGGPVSVHLHNYYWSGLDNAPNNGRLIQSVGSPYRGCTAAGTLANIGKLFGIGCGTNTDLTVDGSALWLSGIQTRVRQKTFFYTTTYELNTFFGDYCNLAINLILNWPNDGTAEFDYTGLPGASNLGNTQKWCHTGGMAYPAQYLDRTRNRAINSAAAR